MSDDIQYPLHGSCNCGRVTYQVSEPFLRQVACHCTDCQKHTQSAFSLVGILPRSGFRLLSGDLASWRKTGDSGNPVDCYFCPVCGNRIYHHSPEGPDSVRLKLGTLDDTRVINPQVHIWTRSKQPWYQIPAGVKTYDTQPPAKS